MATKNSVAPKVKAVREKCEACGFTTTSRRGNVVIMGLLFEDVPLCKPCSTCSVCGQLDVTEAVYINNRLYARNTCGCGVNEFEV